MRVLLVDDDDDVQEILGHYLQQDGHTVVAARTGAEALAAAAGDVDVAVLDLTLPDLDGFEVLRRWRSGQGATLPILLLTARGEESDRLLGLGLGADDYVVKPFSPREVCLRVGRLGLRRSAAEPAAMSSVLRWGRLAMLLDEHRVLAGDADVQLTPREYELLRIFLSRPRHVLSRAAIIGSLWEDGYVSDHVVDVHLASLRRKLGDDLQVENVRGIGYRLVGSKA
ncbi:MAG: response regulator transcription factor [Thermaerobacter sp.]|nr:response regulator transcription factor [Thermaerobacter sp.]